MKKFQPTLRTYETMLLGNENRNENRLLLQLVKASMRDKAVTANPMRTVYKTDELLYFVNGCAHKVGWDSHINFNW